MVTVSAQVKQTLASLKGIRDTLTMFSTHDSNEEIKMKYSKCSRDIGQVIGDLENRLRVLEFEEPQYKGF